MKILPLPPQTIAQLGFTHKVLITYEDVAALATDSASLAIFPLSGSAVAGLQVQDAAFNLVTAFDASDAAINSLLIELGDGVDPNRYILSTQIAVDGTEILNFSRAMLTTPYVYTAADTIDLLFTCAGGGSPLLSEFTSGVLEVYLKLADLNDLERAQ